MSNLISGEETAGRHLVYLPKYTAPNDPLFAAGEEEIWQLFWKNLKRVFPDLDPSEIEQKYLFRERFVQPVPVLHYSDLVPEMQTNVPGLLLANTTQIINSTLNNNAMVKIARQAVTHIVESSSNPSAPSPVVAGDEISDAVPVTQ
jgi:protoporphyrinogen oxidase